MCKLRDEADVIVTNPPFSLFREFLAWILEGKDNKRICSALTGLTTSGSAKAVRPEQIRVFSFPLSVRGEAWTASFTPGPCGLLDGTLED